MRKNNSLSFRSGFQLNGIIIIDGLRSKDSRTAGRLSECINDLNHPVLEFYHELIRVTSASELFEALDHVKMLCRDHGLKPIIHFEVHGDEAVGVAVGDAQELVPWAELLQKFRSINLLCQNNLGVVMAACHGLHLIESIEINLPCPFYFLIGPEHSVTSGIIEDSMLPFYKTLYTTKHIAEAFSVLDPLFQQFLAEKFFVIAFAKYLKNACLGKAGRNRVERLVSEAMATSPLNPERIKQARKFFKKQVRARKTHFIRRASLFLHGKHLHINYDALEAFVLGAEAAKKNTKRRPQLAGES